MKTFKSLKSALLMTAATLGATGAAAIVDRPAYAQEAVRTYNIRAQDLNGALREFAMQTGRDVLYPPAIVAGKRSPGARGQLTESEALRALLAGSGLRFERTATNGYAVTNAVAAAQLGDEGMTSRQGVIATLPEILVEGRLSLNTDIRRTEDDAQPYVVFTSEDVRNSSATTIEDFLKTRLPSNAARDSSVHDGANAFPAGLSSFDLRGLGPEETLILVDGRRLPTVSFGASEPNQPDLSGIPLGAIERIEVLSSTAGGIYGAGATGGVINIILKRDYSGIESQQSYGSAFDTDVNVRRFDLTGGRSFFGGRTRVTFSIGLQDGTALLSRDRDYAQRSRARLLENNPAIFQDLFPVSGYTPNIGSVFGTDLVLDNGTPLNSPITSVPVGYGGPITDGGAALVSRAGRYDLGIPAGGQGGDAFLFQTPDVSAFNITVRQELTPSIDAYADIARNISTSRYQEAASGTFVFLDGDAPNNPFTDPIFVSTSSPGLDTLLISKSVVERLSLGLIARLPHDWSAELGYGTTSSFGSGQRTAVTIPDSMVVLRDVNVAPIDYSLIDATDLIFDPTETNLETISARLSGPFLDLPGGRAVLTALAEHRQQDVRASFVSAFSGGFLYVPQRSQTTDSVYLEARWPLVSLQNASFLLRELDVQTSVRHDRYQVVGAGQLEISQTVPSKDGPLPDIDYEERGFTSTDYTIGLKYKPHDDVIFRVSYGTGFLPPSISQVGQSQVLGCYVGADPLRPGRFVDQEVPCVYRFGGSIDLRPEKSTSISVGAVIEPTIVNGLRASIDFTRIEKVDEIYSPSFLQISQLDEFAGRIVRGPNLPGDDPSWAGPVIEFDGSLINVSETQIDAWDFQVDYDRDFGGYGSVRSYVIATYTAKTARQIVPIQNVFDSVGFLDGPLQWRGNAGIDWYSGSWAAGWNAQYYDSYTYYRSQSGPAEIAQVELNQGTARVPAEMYHDVRLTYNVGGMGVLRGAQIGLSIQNVLDTQPHIFADTGALYSRYADPRGRRFVISLRQTF